MGNLGSGTINKMSPLFSAQDGRTPVNAPGLVQAPMQVDADLPQEAKNQSA